MAKAPSRLSYFYGSVTQGAADAFAVASLTTPIAGRTTAALLIRELVFDGIPPLSQANPTMFEFSLGRITVAASPNFATAKSVIWREALQQVASAAGQASYPRTRRYKFTDEDRLLIVEDSLFLSVDSTGTSLASTLSVRIGYEEMSINEQERNAMLLELLTS
jgi:hypothetical protein